MILPILLDVLRKVVMGCDAVVVDCVPVVTF